MSMVFVCPECERELKAPENAAGKTMQCPSCGARIPPSIDVPVAESAPVPEAVTATPTLRSRPIREGAHAEDVLPSRRQLVRKRSSNGLIIGLVVGASLLLMLLLASGIGLVLYFALNKTISESDWQQFSPPGSGCTVLMPGTPTTQSQVINGITLNRYIVKRLRQRLVFGVVDANLGAASFQPNEMDIRTTAERNNLIQQMNGMLQGERAITLGAIPGREFDIIAHDGSRLIVQLYFIRVGGVHRLCELTAGGFSVSPDNRDVLRFFHSLQMDATVSPPVIAGNPAVRGSKPPDVKLPKASPRRKPKTLP